MPNVGRACCYPQSPSTSSSGQLWLPIQLRRHPTCRCNGTVIILRRVRRWIMGYSRHENAAFDNPRFAPGYRFVPQELTIIKALHPAHMAWPWQRKARPAYATSRHAHDSRCDCFAAGHVWRQLISQIEWQRSPGCLSRYASQGGSPHWHVPARATCRVGFWGRCQEQWDNRFARPVHRCTATRDA